MELKEFINQTFTAIFEGVKSAQSNLQETGGVVNPAVDSALPSTNSLYFGMSKIENPSQSKDRVFLLEFDIVVDAEEAKSGKVAGGVFLASLGLGAQSSDSHSNKLANRIKFVVPYSLPRIPVKITKEDAELIAQDLL